MTGTGRYPRENRALTVRLRFGRVWEATLCGEQLVTDKPHRRSIATTRVLFIVIGTAIGVLGTVVVQDALRVQTDWVVLGAFLTSPGFGGLCALGAAAIAFVGISRQIAASREATEKQIAASRDATEKQVAVSRDASVRQHKVENDRAWWQQFEWVSNRAIPIDTNHEKLPFAVVVSALQALERAAGEAVQKRAIRAVMDVAAANDGGSGSPEEQSEGRAAAEREALSAFVSQTSSTPASSPAALSRLYELEVADALQRIGDGLWEVRIDPASTRYGGSGARVVRYDAAVVMRGRRVGIEIVGAATRDRLRFTLPRKIAAIRGNSGTDPVVIITRNGPVLAPEDMERFHCVEVQWKSVQDDRSLGDAVEAASQLSEWVPDGGIR